MHTDVEGCCLVSGVLFSPVVSALVHRNGLPLTSLSKGETQTSSWEVDQFPFSMAFQRRQVTFSCHPIGPRHGDSGDRVYQQIGQWVCYLTFDPAH